ncbi:MAG: hypothetical protein V4494_06855, partial [Chlamydiota bacterium]
MSNIANATFGYQETVTGAIAPQIAEQFDLSMSVIMDNTETLADQIGTIGAAARNEATAKKKQIGKQALGQLTQGAGQLLSAGIQIGGSIYMAGGIGSATPENNYGEKNPFVNTETIKANAQMSTLEGQRMDLEGIQTNFKQAAIAAGATGEINLEGGDAVHPSIEARKTQFAVGDFSENPEALKAWNDSLPEGYKDLDGSDLDKQAMLHMAQEPEGSFKGALSSLENQISDLNKKVGKTSDDLTNRLTKLNNYVSIGKDVVSSLSSAAQAGFTASSAKWAQSEILSQNVASVAQMMLQTLEKMLQQAYQGVDGTTNSMVSAAQI